MMAPFESPQDRGHRLGWGDVFVSGLIIALLLGLLLPALFSTHGRQPPSARIRWEISILEDAIMQFTVTYGVEPPSGIVLHADQASWDRDRRSQMLIRQLWPKFDFANCGGLQNVPPDGITLTGAECLVFFLGGMVHPTTGEFHGFAKHSAHPFANDVTSRAGPFFEFIGAYQPETKRWVGRLIDQDQDGFPEYLDPLPQQTQPYLYASNYSGGGYRAEDLGGAMQDVYRGNDGVAYKPKGLQIISAGADGKFGRGGVLDPENADAVLSADRAVERDNVTNFIASTLCQISEPRTLILWIVGIANLLVFILVAGTYKLRGIAMLMLTIVQLLLTGLVVPAITAVR